jgi:hypothetical protein
MKPDGLVNESKDAIIWRYGNIKVQSADQMQKLYAQFKHDCPVPLPSGSVSAKFLIRDRLISGLLFEIESAGDDLTEMKIGTVKKVVRSGVYTNKA